MVYTEDKEYTVLKSVHPIEIDKNLKPYFMRTIKMLDSLEEKELI